MILCRQISDVIANENVRYKRNELEFRVMGNKDFIFHSQHMNRVIVHGNYNYIVKVCQRLS